MLTDDSLRDHVARLFEASIQTKRAVLDTQTDSLLRLARLVAESLAKGGKILLCGNGGSAADAQHLAAELLIRLRPHINRRALPAIALAMDSSTLTACGNDYGFDDLYAKMVQALGRPGDVLIGITTSGKSKNVLLALEAARAAGIHTAGFLGGTGGAALELCDIALVVPSPDTGRVQESHITLGHALMELAEEILLENGSIVKL